MLNSDPEFDIANDIAPTHASGGFRIRLNARVRTSNLVKNHGRCRHHHRRTLRVPGNGVDGINALIHQAHIPLNGVVSSSLTTIAPCSRASRSAGEQRRRGRIELVSWVGDAFENLNKTATGSGLR